MDLSLTALRVFRSVAERGSFTAAALATGYTQSAVSRQIASLETATGAALVERRPDGVRLTDAGRTLLHRAARALDELEAAGRELTGGPPRERVRLGAFPSAGAWLVPRVLAEVRDVELVTSSGSSRSLVRALRSGSIDLAVLARTPPYRPFDDETPALVTRRIAQHELLVAVPASSRFRGSVPVEELVGEPWIGSGRAPDEMGLGVWPGLPGRAHVVHSSPDWLTKLQLVAAGAGLTSLPRLLVPVLPAGVRAVRVVGGSREERQLVLARAPGPAGPARPAVEAALISVAGQLSAVP